MTAVLILVKLPPCAIEKVCDIQRRRAVTAGNNLHISPEPNIGARQITRASFRFSKACKSSSGNALNHRSRNAKERAVI